MDGVPFWKCWPPPSIWRMRLRFKRYWLSIRRSLSGLRGERRGKRPFTTTIPSSSATTTSASTAGGVCKCAVTMPNTPSPSASMDAALIRPSAHLKIKPYPIQAAYSAANALAFAPLVRSRPSGNRCWNKGFRPMMFFNKRVHLLKKLGA